MLKTPQTRIILTLPGIIIPPNDFFQQNWIALNEFLNICFLKPLSTPAPFINYQSLYIKVEQICRNHQETQLINSLSSYLDHFLEQSLEKLDKSTDFLHETSIFWSQTISAAMPLISGIFRYFESVFLKPVAHLKTFENFLYSRLALAMNKNLGFKHKIVDSLLELINCQRRAIPFSNDALNSCWELIQKVSSELYQQFEPRFIIETEQFYRGEGDKWLTTEGKFDVRGYVRFVDDKFELESEKKRFFRENSTEVALAQVLEKELIERSIDRVLEFKIFASLIESKDVESLEKVYRQLFRINKVEVMKKSWFNSLKEITKGLMTAITEISLIERLLTLRKDAIMIVKEAFQSNKSLRTAVDSAISATLDLNPNKTAELASKEFDLKLRKGGKNTNIQAEDSTKKDLDEIFEVFRYITAKDMFEEFYTRRLAKRLLFGGIFSHELELHILDKLKQECGSGYIKKAEEIFKDVEISKQINQEFSDFLQKNKKPMVEFYVTVLHSNSWPLANAALPALIEPFEAMKNTFCEFYATKQPGVLLSWQFEGSFCDLYWFFKGEKFLLNLSILQAMILLLFNAPASNPFQKILTLKTIQNLIQFDPEEIKKALYSLYLMKEKVLIKTLGDQKAMSATDEFKINENYSSKARVIKINSVYKKETATEIKETEEKVLHERQYVIDAAIVRIMKAKKSIGHNELVNEVFNDLKLPILVSDAKKRIESLIGRDYLCRDKNNTQVYHYVA